MTPPLELEHVLGEAGLLRPGVAVAVAAVAPSTGPLRWATGQCGGGPVDTRTSMYAASVTKQLVAVLAARQVLAGLLDPEDSVVDLLPALPGWAVPVRVRHLVHHTSGLPATGRVLAATGLGHDVELDNDLVLDGLGRLPGPDQPPGRAFSYSNVGYVVLAEVVAAVAGEPLADLAERSLLGPLGLSGSRLGGAPPAWVPPAARPPATLGDGGWWTSADDLVAWLDALNRGALGRALTDLVQTPGRLDDGTPLTYAWGVPARPDRAGTLCTHGGSWSGWGAKTVRRSAGGTAVALLSTSDDVDAVSGAALALHERLV